MVIYRVVGIDSKRRKTVRWEMSERMAKLVAETFANNGMNVDYFEHDIPMKKGELLEWLNTYAV